MSQVQIIMAVYNGSTYLREQIESILNNTYQDFILTICDDGSTDNSVTIAKVYEQRYPDKVQVEVNEKNLGVKNNFLTRVRDSKAPYVMFCDQDDQWRKDKIEKSVRAIQKLEQECGADMPITVFGDAIVTDSKLQQLNPSFHGASKLDTSKVDLAHLLMENKLIGCTMILNHAMAEKLTELPRNARMHDWWIGLMGAAFGKVGYISEPLLLYRQHEKNVVGNQSFLDYVGNRVRNLKAQREVIAQTIAQAEEFKRIYGGQLGEKQLNTLNQFIELKDLGFFAKRRRVIKGGYLKSGLVRNIGLLVII